MTKYVFVEILLETGIMRDLPIYIDLHFCVYIKDIYNHVIYFIKRREEISQIKIFNTNLKRNKSNYMNFKHKNTTLFSS